MHSRAVPPAEERLARLVLPCDEILGSSQRLFVDRFHALLGERPEVFDGLATLAVSLGLQHTARTELLQEGLAVAQLHVARIVSLLRLFLCIKVIEAADELIEAVHGGQVLIAITLMILAELTRGVALALQDGGHGDVGLLPAFLRARHSNLGHAGSDRNAAADERGTPGGTTLLRVVIRERHAFARHAI